MQDGIVALVSAWYAKRSLDPDFRPRRTATRRLERREHGADLDRSGRKAIRMSRWHAVERD